MMKKNRKVFPSYFGKMVVVPHMNPFSKCVKISAVIITYNEAKNIRRTLSRLSWCDEIIVVDSYSTDETYIICQQFNCKVFFRHFEGYSEQKYFAVRQAKNDWVLCVDADEVLSEELIVEIQETFKRIKGIQAILFP